jgi:glycosyltransferase involved in cell wall biosynthesis
MRVLRIYHGARSRHHRGRERAIARHGIELSLVLPSSWPGEGAEVSLGTETFVMLELPASRSGDVNRHVYSSRTDLVGALAQTNPHVVDIHEEPFSLSVRQWLAVVPPNVPVLMYTAQNVDKRLPPPFAAYERRAHRRVAALYPCSRQAAAVARGKGFTGIIDVLPLGIDPTHFVPGNQSQSDDEVTLALFGRLVPEKGIRDAIHVLARLHAKRPARLLIVGSGPEETIARQLARELGVADRLELETWLPLEAVSEAYRRAHVVLVPSKATATWTEQFGRVIVEAHASGAVVAGYASGSIPEVGQDAIVLAKEGDVDGLANAVIRVLADPPTFDALRARGIELSSERTWDKVAERQVALYERVLAGNEPRLNLPRSPRRRRALAREEFGPTAPTTAGFRPFALPILRKGGPIPAALGALIDAGAELKAALPAPTR